MKLSQLRNFLSALDDDFEVRVSVEGYKENSMRDFSYVEGRSQILDGVSIEGNVLVLKGVKNTKKELEGMLNGGSEKTNYQKK
ncbi:hypothetical protein IGL98_000958 [Enterococcus sp. DIV0840]|uniref:hypothetical protein n=1 Tax=unclassified Enterococcus TaxID=2608891 RepID=UPI001A8C66A4|nr:hypothetical protein [Enterococcus sp. DIV0849a]MBO0433644.1 hypothetical protein [Enterococcus sp. DIV0849a]